MTETQTRKRKPRRTKMIAVQDLFHGERIYVESECFMYEGKLPSEEIAVKAPDGMPLGVPEPEVVVRGGPKPSWTTDGFVAKATRESGRDDDDDE